MRTVRVESEAGFLLRGAAALIEFEPLAGVPQLSPRKAREKIERKHWPVFDVSEAEEFASSRLPFSKRLAYLGCEKAPLPRGRPFIVACRVGHRSQLVVRKLRRLGFDARNLNGGLWAWECAGLPLAGLPLAGLPLAGLPLAGLPLEAGR